MGFCTSVKEVSEVMENIKVASEEQAEGVDQINKAIADMDRITQENSALVEQNTTGQSTHGWGIRDTCRTLINAFKVEDRSGSIDISSVAPHKVEKNKPDTEKKEKVEDKFRQHTGSEKYAWNTPERYVEEQIIAAF